MTITILVLTIAFLAVYIGGLTYKIGYYEHRIESLGGLNEVKNMNAFKVFYQMIKDLRQ